MTASAQVTRGIVGEVELRGPVPSEGARVRAAGAIVDLVDRVVSAPEIDLWPSGGTASLAWSGGFGAFPRAALRGLLLAQLLDPVYLDDVPVFPIVTGGGWRFEVVHPSPRGSSRSMGLFFRGPPDGARVIGAAAHGAGWTEARGHAHETCFQAGGVSLTFEPGSPRPEARWPSGDPARDRAEWLALVREEVAGVGTRVVCEGSVMAATGAGSIADLYGALAGEFGGTCTAEVAWPAELSFSAEHAVAHLTSPAACHAGDVIVLAPEQECRGSLGPVPWPSTTARAAVTARVGGVESTVRFLEHRHSSREPWWSLAVEPVRDATSSQVPAIGGNRAR